MTADVSTRIEGVLRHKLQDGCASGVFPGASAAVALWREGAWSTIEAVAGTRAEGSHPVTADTIYDLASLTKPWVAIAALRLHQAGVFELGARVDGLVPESKGFPIGARTWEEVLSHRSGLEAWVPFYETLTAEPGSDAARAWIFAELLPHWDADSVGTSVYSDLGYMLTGLAMSRAADQSLDDIVAERVALPLRVEDEVFFGASRREADWKARCATTAR